MFDPNFANIELHSINIGSKRPHEQRPYRPCRLYKPRRNSLVIKKQDDKIKHILETVKIVKIFYFKAHPCFLWPLSTALTTQTAFSFRQALKAASLHETLKLPLLFFLFMTCKICNSPERADEMVLCDVPDRTMDHRPHRPQKACRRGRKWQFLRAILKGFQLSISQGCISTLKRPHSLRRHESGARGADIQLNAWFTRRQAKPTLK